MVRSTRSSSSRPFVALTVLLAVAALVLGCSPADAAYSDLASADVAVAVAEAACAADLRAEGTLYWSECG